MYSRVAIHYNCTISLYGAFPALNLFYCIDELVFISLNNIIALPYTIVYILFIQQKIHLI